jgi:hypothetical protein
MHWRNKLPVEDTGVWLLRNRPSKLSPPGIHEFHAVMFHGLAFRGTDVRPWAPVARYACMPEPLQVFKNIYELSDILMPLPSILIASQRIVRDFPKLSSVQWIRIVFRKVFNRPFRATNWEFWEELGQHQSGTDYIFSLPHDASLASRLPSYYELVCARHIDTVATAANNRLISIEVENLGALETVEIESNCELIRNLGICWHPLGFLCSASVYHLLSKSAEETYFSWTRLE